MAFRFYSIMRKRANGETLSADLHKTDLVIYLTKEEAEEIHDSMGEIGKHFAIVPMVAMTEQEWQERNY
jgi:hypothetical protein